MGQTAKSVGQEDCRAREAEYVTYLLPLYSSAYNVEIAASLSTARIKFDSQAGFVRWLSTSGARLGLYFWYRGEPIFWIPEGWAPGYVEWILSWPKAPKGSVSIQIWGFAVSQMLSILTPILGHIIGLFASKLGVGARSSVPMPAAGSEEKVKKEL
jgi:tail-anchored protein insertion receptor